MTVCKWLFGRKRGKRLRFRPDSRVQVTDMSHVRQKWAGGQVKQMTGFDGVKAVSNSTGALFNVSGDYPNEPAGMTLVARCLCNQLPTLASSKPTGWTNSWGTTSHDNLSIVSGQSPPVNGPDVLAINFFNGLDDGNAPCNFYTAWESGALPEDIGELSEQFLGYTFMWYGNGTNYEQQTVGTKFGFWSGPAIGVASNEFFILIPGTGSQALVTSLGVRIDLQGGGGLTNFWTRNVGSGNPIQIATWHKLEIYQKTNDIGVANGILKVWLDSNLILDYSDAMFRNSTYPQKFRNYKMNPTWGGNAGDVKTRDDFVYMADIYISGKL